MPDPTDGYTPVPEALARECGKNAAIVWGVVWRYCQMGAGTCWASQAAIARRACLRRETVCRHLRTLVEAGYLEDLSPATQGRTHTYADTGRVAVGKRTSSPEDEPGACDQPSQPTDTCDERSQPTAPPPVTETHTGCDADAQEGVRESHNRCAPQSHPPVTETHTKKDSKRESKTEWQERQQDTRGVPPRACRDDEDPDELDDQERQELDDHDPDELDDQGPDRDYRLVAENLADFFARATGIPVPIPRTDKELREAHTLWSAPLRQIAATCGSVLAGQRAISSAIAILKAKGCIVKAPISILGTAQSVAGEQAKKRAAWQEINERYGPGRPGFLPGGSNQRRKR